MIDIWSMVVLRRRMRFTIYLSVYTGICGGKERGTGNGSAIVEERVIRGATGN